MDQFIEFLGNHPILSLIWIGLFVMLVINIIQSKLSPIKQITPQDLTFVMNKQDGVVVDIRPDAEFKKGHILGARHLANEKATKSEFASVEKFKSSPIIVVCAAGMTASKAAQNMFKAGFSQVSVLKGGMQAWVGAGLPVAKK